MEEYKNQRTAYGKTLVEMGAEDGRIVCLDADLGNSTMGSLFKKAYPERYFEMGIAEADMLSAAAGLSLTGLIPFANSFAVFCAGRAFDQIAQTIAIGGLNVKICGSSAGLSDFGDGATHQSIDDIAIMRVIPNMTVICPADANEAAQATRAAAKINGPVYLRINRNDYENVTTADSVFEVGKPTVLRDGNTAVVFACGIMCSLALKAAEALAEEGISVKVVNVSTIKPLNAKLIEELAGDCKAVITAEEHSIIGGLGSAIAEALRHTGKPIEFVGVNDCFGCSAHNYQELMEEYGLTAAHIAEAVRDILKNR